MSLALICAGLAAFAFELNANIGWLLWQQYSPFMGIIVPVLIVPPLALVWLGVRLFRGSDTARLICAGVCLTVMLFSFLSVGTETPVWASASAFALSFLALDQLYRPKVIDYFDSSERIRSIFDNDIPVAWGGLIAKKDVPFLSIIQYRSIRAPWAAYVLSWLIAAWMIVPLLAGAPFYSPRARRYRTGYRQILHGATTDQVYQIMGMPTSYDYRLDHQWPYLLADDDICWDRRKVYPDNCASMVLTLEYKTPLVEKTWIVGFDREGRAVAKVDPDD